MSDMPERVRRCTTHHHACDCREYEFEQAKVRIEELTAEVEEQARLLGKSGSREAELLARIEALEDVLREILALDNAIDETTDIANEIELEEMQSGIYKAAAALLQEPTK